MIYFLQAGVALSPVKIGYTADIDQRRKTLQAGNAERLYIVASIPGDEQCERRLHERFANGRLLGEWFRPDTPGLQELISDAIHFEGFAEDDASPAVQAVLSC